VSCAAPEDDPLTFAVSDAWKVVLHPDQTVPEALLVVALRHVARVGDLTADEAAKFFGLFRQLEQALEEALGATMVNVSCLRDWAYRSERPDPPLFEGRPNPCVHWHVAARFEEPVTIAGTSLNDPQFGEGLTWQGRRIDAVRTQAVIDLLAAHLGIARPQAPGENSTG
jgi:diadenosine tetraphosphate (Ap4A) HIT family hydrolase